MVEMRTRHLLEDQIFHVTEAAWKVLDRFSRTNPGAGKTPETAPCRYMKDVFMLAVYLGAKDGRPRELNGKRRDPIRGSAFTHEEQLMLRAIAVGHTGDPEVMADAQKIVRVAEQFANAGVWKLEEIFTRSPEGALWNLADFFLDDLGQRPSATAEQALSPGS